MAGPAAAENRFLNESVPVLGTPALDQIAGDFEFEQSDSGEAVAFWG